MRTITERILTLTLRVIGAASALAAPCALMPYRWMNVIHGWLGLGPLPDAPIVGYLTRSLSAFYALLGGLLWVLSFDVRRHRLALSYLGVAFVGFGLFLFGVGWVEGLPVFWRWWEGSVDVGFGLVIFLLSRGVGLQAPTDRREPKPHP